MARTGLAQDTRFQKHLTGPYHPERPQRLEAIREALRCAGLADRCVPVDATPIAPARVRPIHSEAYLKRLEAACAAGLPYIDVPDSAICGESCQIAKLAAGAVLNTVDQVMTGGIDNAFCAVRPPGHHAERERSMGFCLINNIAVAAAHLLDAYELTRVLILDWDVHHGNGTQHAFESDPRVLFISIHGHPGIVYPGTGYAHEQGIGPGTGYTINCPMLPPSSDEEYQKVFEERILPTARRFAPRFVLVSAGFDAHALDPLAPLELSTAAFGYMTNAALTIAGDYAEGRLVSILEGGYHLEALGDCVVLHVSRLLDA